MTPAMLNQSWLCFKVYFAALTTAEICDAGSCEEFAVVTNSVHLFVPVNKSLSVLTLCTVHNICLLMISFRPLDKSRHVFIGP